MGKPLVSIVATGIISSPPSIGVPNRQKPSQHIRRNRQFHTMTQKTGFTVVYINPIELSKAEPGHRFRLLQNLTASDFSILQIISPNSS